MGAMTGKFTGVLAGRVGNISRFGFVLLTQQEKNSHFRVANQPSARAAAPGSPPTPSRWSGAGAPTLLTSRSGRRCTGEGTTQVLVALQALRKAPSPTIFQPTLAQVEGLLSQDDLL